MACELVAHKLTGEKGVLFTAAYVKRFAELEAAEHAAKARTPRLGEYNAAARLIVRALSRVGASPEQILTFLKNIYEPLGIVIADGVVREYTAQQIAELLGIYSLTGKPHAHAVSRILNELIVLDEFHKAAALANINGHSVVIVKYDDYALRAVKAWLVDNKFPNDVKTRDQTCHIVYRA
ncbi:hypothetical protein FACS18949_02240 [Clostridia bacterium]|nr:hypothetical protein FACS18949_02240 [Clostridia bacterium]